jgi:hypothetical protein
VATKRTLSLRVVTFAAIFAFLEAGLAGLLALIGVPPFGLGSAFDVICLIGLGIATLRRHLWGAYALTAYAALILL